MEENRCLQLFSVLVFALSKQPCEAPASANTEFRAVLLSDNLLLLPGWADASPQANDLCGGKAAEIEIKSQTEARIPGVFLLKHARRVDE